MSTSLSCRHRVTAIVTLLAGIVSSGVLFGEDETLQLYKRWAKAQCLRSGNYYVGYGESKFDASDACDQAVLDALSKSSKDCSFPLFIPSDEDLCYKEEPEVLVGLGASASLRISGWLAVAKCRHCGNCLIGVGSARTRAGARLQARASLENRHCKRFKARDICIEYYPIQYPACRCD